MNEEKRLQRRQRLMDNRAYQTMQGLTRYMDRYYLDALIGIFSFKGFNIIVCKDSDFFRYFQMFQLFFVSLGRR